MKFIKIKNTILLATTMAITAIGCKKADFNINKNDDAVTENSVDYRTVLPASISTTASSIASQWKFMQNWMSYWARSGSFQSINTEETYDFTNGFNVGIWNTLYLNNNNYQFVEQKAKAAGAGKYEAIARIMKAHNYQILVDVYGNIPYSEALKGNDNKTPKYDKGLAIYKSILAECDAAIAILKDPIATTSVNNGDIAANDLVYQGDAGKWIKFANTLKLRVLIHCSAPTVASQIDVTGEMAKITANGGGFIQSGESAHINPGYASDKPNPYYATYVKGADGAETTASTLNRGNIFAVGPLGGSAGYYGWNGDPRIDRFYVKPFASAGVPAASHRGIAFGEVSGANPGNSGDKLSSVNGPGLIPNGAASRAWILTSVESLFLQAEARQRGWLTAGPSALALTNAGITESFVWLGLTAAQASAYISGNATYPDVDFNGVSQGPGLPAGGLFTILSQKWFSLNAIAPYEVWTDFRRTDQAIGEGGGYTKAPVISINPDNQALKVPIRLLYPQSENSFNTVNVNAEGTINVFSSKIFWDIN